MGKRSNVRVISYLAPKWNNQSGRPNKRREMDGTWKEYYANGQLEAHSQNKMGTLVKINVMHNNGEPCKNSKVGMETVPLRITKPMEFRSGPALLSMVLR